MNDSEPRGSCIVWDNPQVEPQSDAALRVLPAFGAARARRVIAGMAGYAPTPLLACHGLGRELGVAELWVKDETDRFGLGSFKALGGAYAVAEVVSGALGSTPEGALAGERRSAAAALTVACASAGNHGLSVAWGARRVGARSVVALDDSVPAAFRHALAALGARVLALGAGYDQAVVALRERAGREGWMVVSDTSWPGYEEVPRLVMQGYRVLVSEAIDQLAQAGSASPTHVVVQAGVGGLAAAVVAHLHQEFGAARPRLVVVEPAAAACVLASAQAGRLVRARGNLETEMKRLSCAEASPLAWPVLREGVDHFAAIADHLALRAAASFERTPSRLRVDASGAAGLGFLHGVADAESARQRVRLSATSRVLVIATETRRPG